MNIVTNFSDLDLTKIYPYLVYSLQENVFIGSRPNNNDDNVKSVLFPDLKIEINSVFKNIL
jgi:hypothetical protein